MKDIVFYKSVFPIEKELFSLIIYGNLFLKK